MKYEIINNDIVINSPQCLSLEETLLSGQCFRWEKSSENEFIGIAFGKKISVKQIENKIIFKNCCQKDYVDIWEKYFDIDRNYIEIKNNLSAIDENLSKACDYGSGVRILKQDCWEALCSFIISQNNNIPRIKGIISRMCELFGEQISDDFYTFPTAEILAQQSIDTLSPLRAGFRAKYILDASQKVASGEIDLHKIEKMSLEDARKELMKIKGVGPKVAECVLLYGMGRLDAFPIDVWIKRAMQFVCPTKNIEDFGEYAGIAQQYLFEYTRNMKITEG